MIYLARVELHSASTADYTKLHALMEARGFSRKILSNTGIWYHLPTAEYRVETDRSMDAVLNAAKAAADGTGRSNGVIVTKTAGMKWNGLTPVSKVPVHR